MSAESLTKDALLAWTGLTALVGGRIDPDEIGEGEDLPALSFERSDTVDEYGLDNSLYGSKVSMIVTVWAKTRAAANQVADEATLAMDAEAFVRTSRASAYEPDLDQYAVVLGFEVWEI